MINLKFLLYCLSQFNQLDQKFLIIFIFHKFRFHYHILINYLSIETFMKFLILNYITLQFDYYFIIVILVFSQFKNQ